MLMRAEACTPQGSACDPCRDASAAGAAGFCLLASATPYPWAALFCAGVQDAAFELQFICSKKDV